MDRIDSNTGLLVQQIYNSKLYSQVILQIQKDFYLCGETLALEESILPDVLVQKIYQKIYFLLQHNFNAYLQLLYRIDIAEDKIATRNETIAVIAQKASYYILQREYQKINLRNVNEN